MVTINMSEEYANEINRSVEEDGMEIAISCYGADDVYDALKFLGIYQEGDYSSFQEEFLTVM